MQCSSSTLFLGAWKLVKDGKFDEFDVIAERHPHMLNNLRGVFDKTLLMEVVRENNTKAVDHLLTFPQDVSVVDEDGKNVLHYAGRYANEETIRLLDDRLENTERLINVQDKYGKTPLHIAALRNNHSAIEWMLKNGADVNIRNNGGQLADEPKKCDEKTKMITGKARRQQQQQA